MNVSSVEFVAAVLAAASVFFYLPSVGLRQTVFACGNALAVWLLLPNAWSAAALAVFLLSGYLVARVLAARPSRAVLAGYLAMLVAAFVVLKQYDFLRFLLPGPVLAHPVRIVGLSYMLFRQIHFLVDTAQGQTGRIALWTYANYQLNLFGLLSGPIQRYQAFRDQWDVLRPVLVEPGDLLQNCLRLLMGVLKIAMVAPVFYLGWSELWPVLVRGGLGTPKFLIEFLVVFYFYPMFLYFNFSGYCDIVIAAGRFFGIELPENFDRPYLARNVLEFWTRWHMTLGFWIRDYLFMPMYKPIVERWPRRAPRLAPLCYFAAFVVAGVWHGSTLNFLVYGVWQGVGASAVKLYENQIVRLRGRAGLGRYLKSPSIRVAAIVLNLHFQCVSLFFFALTDVGDAMGILRNLWSAISGHPG